MGTGYHAEHVGSLLRPRWLLEARAASKRGERSAAELRDAEDRAAAEVIELQREAGLRVFTDGEVRRTNWMDGLLSSIGGLVPVGRAQVDWFRPEGTPPAEETEFDTFAANAPVFQRVHHTSDEAAFMSRQAPGQFKITMISASMGGLLWDPELSAAVYPTPDDLVRDLVGLQIAEIKRLIDSGVSWIQLDSLGYNRVMDAHFLAETAPRVSPQDVLAATVDADVRVVRAAKRRNPGVSIGMHICRGNNRSAWMAEGGYEPVAERLFGEVGEAGVDRFLLEYDSGRAGGFEPLRLVRPGTTVVLGLVSSKVPALESPDELRRRVDQAAAFVPLENLALSPQCGFASTAPGNLLTIDEERRKLALVADTAERIWG